MGQVYPPVGLDCVGLGRNFSTFNESFGMAAIAKCVLKYISITTFAHLHCLRVASFFVGSGFVGSRTRGLHGLDWVCLILG